MTFRRCLGERSESFQPFWWHFVCSHQSYIRLYCVYTRGQFTSRYRARNKVEKKCGKSLKGVSDFCRKISAECQIVLFLLSLVVVIIIYLHTKKGTDKGQNGKRLKCPLRLWWIAWLIFCAAVLTSNLLLFYDFSPSVDSLCWRSAVTVFVRDAIRIACCLLMFRRNPNPTIKSSPKKKTGTCYQCDMPHYVFRLL